MLEDYIYKYLKDYEHSGQIFKNVLGRFYRLIPLEARYGRTYIYYKNLLKESQWWDRERLRQFQTERLKGLIKHCYENVPYYRKLFLGTGIMPQDIKKLEDIKRIPLLTKQDVRRNLSDLIATNCPKYKLLYQTTGGSTGSPLVFYHQKGKARSKELAFFQSMWERVGYKLGDKVVSIRGETIDSADKGVYWHYEPIQNKLKMSIYHMSDKNMPAYISVIRRFKPKFLYTYPSGIILLARFMKSNNIKPIMGLKGILCGSEHLYSSQEALLKEVFQCRIFRWYGMGEKVVLGGSCDKSSYYHIFPEYGITELIDGQGCDVTEEGKAGDIIGTSFDNDIMPFLRYKTEDVGIYTTQKCGCGREYVLFKEIEGRKQEYFISKDNEVMPINSIVVGLDYVLFDAENKGWQGIDKFQFLQEKKGELILRIVKRRGSKEEELNRVINLFKKRLGYSCDILVEFVDEIPRTNSGKHRYFIQKLPVGDYNHETVSAEL